MSHPVKRPRLADGSNASIVKQAPIKDTSSPYTQIYISKKTPFVSALNRITKALKKTENKPVEVIGMGITIEKTLSLALWLKRKYHVQILTTSVECHDEIIPHDEDLKNFAQSRLSSGIKLVVFT